MPKGHPSYENVDPRLSWSKLIKTLILFARSLYVFCSLYVFLGYSSSSVFPICSDSRSWNQANEWHKKEKKEKVEDWKDFPHKQSFPKS